MSTSPAAPPRVKRRLPSARGVARLAAVQALYQHGMAATPVALLLTEFHHHRLGVGIEDEVYVDPDEAFFDDVVSGTLARSGELERRIASHLASGWSFDRLDRPMRAILLAGTYEIVARADVPIAAIVSAYADVAQAFYEPREVGFVNALLDSLAKATRTS